MVCSTRNKCYNKRKHDGETTQETNVQEGRDATVEEVNLSDTPTSDHATTSAHTPTSEHATTSADTPSSEDLPKQKGPKKTRGQTKMRDIAMDPGNRVHVDFTVKGEPCGPGSVKLSSYLGPLVREHVPVTLDNWHYLSEKIKMILWKSVQVFYVIG